MIGVNVVLTGDVTALMLQKNPALTGPMVETLLEGAAKPMGAGCATVNDRVVPPTRRAGALTPPARALSRRTRRSPSPPEPLDRFAPDSFIVVPGSLEPQ